MASQDSLFPSLPDPEASGSEADTPAARPRVLEARRDQLELRPVDLEAALAPDHPARSVWAFVEHLDLSALYAEISALEGRAGRPAIDPRILMSLWLYATVEGVGSARALARLCEHHDAYRWICGGVSVGYHRLSDFRVAHVAFLDEQLSRAVAVLMHQGLVELNRVAQDGMRVRAGAGAASFRRRSTLKRCQREARKQVERLRREVEEDPAQATRRERAARERAASEREARLARALEELERIERDKDKPRAKKATETDEEHAKRTEPRASSTDPEARVMKMADGGFRPAYNVQFGTDTDSQVIVGVEVCNVGSDMGQLAPMLDQLQGRYERLPEEVLVDGGYASGHSIEDAHGRGVTVYAPPTKPRDPTRDPYTPRPGDSEALAQWRQRMGGEPAKELYPQRAATAECVNAQARQRGLQRFTVRGQHKARAVALWYALAHNFRRAMALGGSFAPA